MVKAIVTKVMKRFSDKRHNREAMTSEHEVSLFCNRRPWSQCHAQIPGREANYHQPYEVEKNQLQCGNKSTITSLVRARETNLVIEHHNPHQSKIYLQQPQRSLLIQLSSEKAN